MDFRLTPEEEKFRDELKAWVQREFPEGGPVPKLETWEDRAQACRSWQRRLFEAGYAGISHPVEYGGRGGTLMQEIIAADVLGPTAEAQGGGPDVVGFPSVVAQGIAANVIFSCGTEEQKKHFIPKIFDGTHIWCQAFSEPNNGSDAAGITTRAERQGDHYLVNGQKIWTSFAHIADYSMLLVRTNRSLPKHLGLSYLLLDLKTPGVEVRPIRQISEDSEFNEVFLTDVRVPADRLVGEENGGWKIAIATLMFERVMGDIKAANAYLGEFHRMLAMAKSMKRSGKPVLRDPVFRQEIAQCYIELMALRYTGYRSASKILRGHVPGPEGSIGKLLWSEAHVHLGELAMQIQGPHHQLMERSPRAVEGGAWQYLYLRSRGNTIEGGSSEVMKNIIGERVLGLPKDAARA